MAKEEGLGGRQDERTIHTLNPPGNTLAAPASRVQSLCGPL